VTFYDFLTEEGIVELLRSADVSISIPISDGTAVSVLESMASGLPVIVSDLPRTENGWRPWGGVLARLRDQLSDDLIKFYEGNYDLKSMGEHNRSVYRFNANRKIHFDR